MEVKRAGAAAAAPSHVEEPIRAELFGAERLAQHAETLAAADRITEKPIRGRDLLPRVRENGRVLLNAYHSTAETVREKSEITPAAEWLLDNFHVVDEQLREWKRFEITYRHGGTLYRITVENPNGVCRGVSGVSLDGTLLSGEGLVPLSDDGLEHRVRVVLG